MALSFIILTLLIAGSIIGWSYSMYVPFFVSMQQNSQQIETYYIARAAMERWQLAIQYHPLWFAWSGGVEWEMQRGPSSDQNITTNTTKMWWITNNQDAGDKDNKLYIQKTEKIYLGYDNTTAPNLYYQNVRQNTAYKWDTISIDIQIPSELKNAMGQDNALLCDEDSAGCDIDHDDIYDDVIVQRDRKGQTWPWHFWIIPYTSINKWPRAGTVDYTTDTNIRETIINNEQSPTLLFTNSFNPLAQNNLPDALSWHNMSWLVISGIQSQTFSDIISDNNIDYNTIHLQMINPSQRRDAKIYPYMTYRINTDQSIATPINTIKSYAQINQSYISIESNKPSPLTKQKGSFSISTHTDE